jgi:hypothetical protein
VLESDGSMNLQFGGAADPIGACGNWENQSGTSAPLNCGYLIRAEQRWGNGDGIFTQKEQERASDALYYANGRGENFFYGQGTRIRVGVEFNF